MSTNLEVCFVIPVHTPDYKYLKGLTKIVEKSKVDIFIVLSMKDIEIETKYPRLKYLYFDEIYGGNVTNWPTQKKFYALHYLFNNYTYSNIIACDSEIRLYNLFNSCSLLSICKSIFNNRKFYGGGNCDKVFQDINLSSMEFVGLNVNLIKKYSNIYFWFSQLPVYEKKSFLSFFKDQDLFKREYHFNHFDYLLYAYWLVKNDGFEIVDWNCLEDKQVLTLNCSGELIENNKFMQLLEKHEIYLYWLSSHYGNSLKNKYSILRYHIDRELHKSYYLIFLSKVNQLLRLVYAK